MFVEARHDFDEVARHVAIIQLVGQNAVPAILAGARAAGQCKQIGAARNAAGASVPVTAAMLPAAWTDLDSL